MRFAVLALVWSALAASPTYCAGLPAHAQVLEEEPVPVWAHKDRALVLWVVAPADKPLQGRTLLDETDSSPEEDYDYTCPEQARGHFYRAPARVSLIDTKSRRVLNTLPVKRGDVDEYDVPFSIRPGFFYQVRGPLQSGTGPPHILALQDLNGDGKALEFAFYVMESCSGPLTMVLGYSERRDRVTTYQFLFHDKSSGAKDAPVEWMFRFTFRKPIARMHWRYDDSYNSGRNVEYDFRYVPDRERFEGQVLVDDSDTYLGKK